MAPYVSIQIGYIFECKAVCLEIQLMFCFMGLNMYIEDLPLLTSGLSQGPLFFEKTSPVDKVPMIVCLPSGSFWKSELPLSP